MSGAVLITIRLHDGRYHGSGEGSPSPARIFQALLAGAGLSGPVTPEDTDALKWLEEREPPIIAAPVMVDGQRVMTYVPNNDLDAMEGDPRRIGKIRVAKPITPRVFDACMPWMYAWAFDRDQENERQAKAVCRLADRLYQFGRGVDMAWAWGELLDDEELNTRMASYRGQIYRPSGGAGSATFACPELGSLKSLKERYSANRQRFKTEAQGKTARQIFSQPPKPRFVRVGYESPPSRRVYAIRKRSIMTSFGFWPLARASTLVTWLRDGAVERLRKALPDRSLEIERVLIGRRADGDDRAPTFSRVRIVPLPSIGHHHADHCIRRILVEVPSDCLLCADDLNWAFSGLDLSDPETGEVLDLILVPSDDESILAQYGAADHVSYRGWRTVTPAALPEPVKRRRIEPTRRAAEAKGGAERVTEQARAGTAVTQALRHIGIRIPVTAVRVQREPFGARGERVEMFAPGTRFSKERLWHVEITFNAPVGGPLIIGDGRFLGLGVMAPIRKTETVYSFLVESGLATSSDPIEIARALRRAVMARVQDTLGHRASLPTFFTGHERDGAPAQTENHPHLAFAFDPSSARLLVIAPHVLDRRVPTVEESEHLKDLDQALRNFRELRAGSAGCLGLRMTVGQYLSDPIFARSRTWESVTSYQVTRHAKRVGASEALSADIRAECRRRGLPAPHVLPLALRGVRGIGLVGGARLKFEVAVEGPILLGRNRHFGGGLFAAVDWAETQEGPQSTQPQPRDA